MNPTLPNEKMLGTREESPFKHHSEHIEIDHAAEKNLVRKLDLYIIPIVMLLYLFSFLDRQVTLNPRDSASQESNQSIESISAMRGYTD